MATKRVTMTAEFMAAAADDAESALAFMLMSAFGISLAEIIQIAEALIAANDAPLITLALAAAVQIRGNVVFVREGYAGVRDRFPSLIIEGDRPQEDKFNFSALHCLGHVLAHWSSHSLGSKILKKAGSCITGQDTTKNAAGEINSEIARGWSPEDVMLFNTINMSQKYAALLGKIMDGAVVKATAFRNAIKPAASASTTSTTPTTRQPQKPPVKQGT